MSGGRDRYLLGEEEHPGRQATIQELIQRLEAEIARGEAVYSTAELERLKVKLDGYRFNLLMLNNP